MRIKLVDLMNHGAARTRLIPVLFVSMLGFVPVAQSQPTPAPTQKSAEAITPLPVPKTPEEFEKVRAAINEQLDELPAEEVGPESSAALQQKLAAASAAREVLATCLEQLDVYKEMLKKAATLGSEEQINQRSADVDEYRSRTAQLQAWMKDKPGSAPQAELEKRRADIAAEYKRINALTDTTNKQQTNRTNTIGEFTQRESDATKAAADARFELDTVIKQLPNESEKDVDAATARDIHHYNLVKSSWKVFLADLRIEQLAAQKINLNLEMSATDLVLPELKAYVKALGDYRTRLETRASVDETETIEQQLKTAKSPADVAYWTYRNLIATTQKEFLSHRDDIRNRYRESDKNDLSRNMKQIRAKYTRLQDRLSRISGAEKTSAYRTLIDLSEDYAAQLTELSAELDLARIELDELLIAQDDAAEDMAAASAALKDATSKITELPEQELFAARSAELASKYRPALDETISEIISAARGSVNRLEESVKELSVFLEDLARFRQGLYWSYTLARSQHIGGKIKDAYDEFQSGKSTAQITTAIEALKPKGTANESSPIRVAIIVIVLGVFLGAVVRSRANRLASKTEDDVTALLQAGTITEVGMTSRFRIQIANITAYCVIVALPLALIGGWIALSDYRGNTLAVLLMRLSLLGTVAAITRASLVHLFRSGKPRFRIIPCSNNVAQYYRRWCGIFWWLALAFGFPVVFLKTLEAAPALYDGLWAVYCTAALVLAVLFLRDRNSVVRVLGRKFAQRRPIVFGAIVQVYPILVLVLLALLIAEVVGYGAFVDYLARNVVHTVAAFALAVLLGDVLGDLRKKAVPPKATADADDDKGDADHELDELLGGVESRELGLVVGGVTSVLQWIVWVAAIVWICAAWGMTSLSARAVLMYELAGVEDQAITVWRVIAAIVAMFAVLKISKAVRATLNAKIYPTYAGINRGAQATINALLHYMLVVLGLYISFRLVHINLGALAVLFGGLGLGLGLGLQPLLVNFMSGLLLFAERHVKVGDIVEVNGELGEVVRISMRSTQIKSFDNIDRIVPNSDFITSSVTNWTLNNDTKIRGKISVGVAYGTDVARVRDLLLEIAQSEPLVVADPEPAVWFVNFGESSLDFIAAMWFQTPGDRWAGMVNMRYEIDRRFKEAGIEIPFPQRTISFLPDSKVAVQQSGGVVQRDIPVHPEPDVSNHSPDVSTHSDAELEKTQQS
ncbi:MAG TPA: mechanosensitive ion channel [Phycisphaerae bacterium]|nr:mechanosensitive ion channel [Phycisphaerae bacterium]